MTLAWVAAAHDELLNLSRAPLPCAVTESATWQALVLRRDIQALRRSAPPHGLSNLSKDLDSHKSCDRATGQTFDILDRRAASTAGGLALNTIFGTWKGGIATSEVPREPGLATCSVFDLRILSWNVRGALMPSHQEAQNDRIWQLVTALHTSQVSIAIISEPCFGPGMRWPKDWL